MSAIEYRIFGPPGTGKTTSLSKQIQNAARKHGRGKVFVASFTRAAAVEVAGRNENIPHIGTLHSHGYHALGERSEVAENHLADWNKEEPRYELSNGKSTDVDDVREFAPPTTDGDELFAEMQLNRARMIPVERWKIAVQAFAKRWEDWKRYNGIIDFMDMIAIPLEQHIPLPYDISVGFFDEAQDFTPMELALVRQWGEDMDYIVLAGDDDQTIFEWAGATPSVLIGGECAQKIILEQSYRVPRAVHALSQKVISAIVEREQKAYKPRDYDGEVRTLLHANYNAPEAIVADMEKYLADGKSIMYLASCSYMLEPMIKALRAAGLPFWNPYRVKAGRWNPLRQSSKGRTSSVDRMLNYLDQIPMRKYPEYGEPLLDIEQFISWYEILKAQGNIPRGAKNTVINRLRDLHEKHHEPQFGASLLTAFFEQDCAVLKHRGSGEPLAALRWFSENVANSKKKALAYPCAVAERRGLQALRDKPQIVIGTIHSVKGGEADVVYVAPDLSRNAYAQRIGTAQGRDAFTRLQYVAYTRARESLCLLGAAGMYVM